VLLPTLYAIFTADISKPDGTKIPLYADDTAILTRLWSPELATQRLQSAVESLETWFRLWRIDVNPEKNSAILLTRRLHRPSGQIVILNRAIPWKTEAKYLGIKFDNHLRFNAQVEHVKTRAQTVRGKLNSLVCRRSKLSTKNKITIYRTIVRPAMMYGAAVWGNVSNTQLQKLQVMQNKFLRAAFNAPWFVRNAQLHREANLPTIREYLHDVNDDNHPNPLVRESVYVCSSDRTEVTPPVFREVFRCFYYRSRRTNISEYVSDFIPGQTPAPEDQLMRNQTGLIFIVSSIFILSSLSFISSSAPTSL
jgi:hypothetical protein